MLFRLPLKPHARLESNLEDNIFLKRFTLFPLGSLSCIFLCCCGSYFLIKMHFFHVLFILFAKTRVLCWFYIYKGYLILCIFFIVLSMCSTTWFFVYFSLCYRCVLLLDKGPSWSWLYFVVLLKNHVIMELYFPQVIRSGWPFSKVSWRKVTSSFQNLSTLAN
jgi:hypothetical protein